MLIKIVVYILYIIYNFTMFRLSIGSRARSGHRSQMVFFLVSILVFLIWFQSLPHIQSCTSTSTIHHFQNYERPSSQLYESKKNIDGYNIYVSDRENGERADIEEQCMQFQNILFDK